MPRFPTQQIPLWVDVREGDPWQVRAQAQLTALLRQAQAEQQRQAMAMLATRQVNRIQAQPMLAPPQWQDPGPVRPMATPQPGDLLAALRQQYGFDPAPRNPFGPTSRR